ncbi:MAG: sigma-54-dependent Fis family transcriptional regulator [Candidatus Accumulibacter sp.]|uniref:sigma-54-dependent transcriptional regulator n=1 Tax=Accumulibacter sp. TaxID=2053492 RepID=UPI0019DCEED5|nr:sigma-54 dependent transcriptional regulator [Accumulibacter sp.]MBE2257612.1 sigma-54-dependent Fis family transcriptional regulator [Paracoccaceae bacterium]MCB1941720.1 sigma-54-dependent Fis family transcriptional regulator [Accumulibacter sp.]MCP5247464.1 sigma-54-dependent Fis family transcriptional regulator [Accumulibacter sp.]
MSVVKTERRPRGELARVLVIDDEADIRELLDLTVARMGLSADCAASVAEAQELLARQRYQLCLTDMRLPDGDGLEIVKLIGERYGETPVAVITAYGSAQNAVAALKAGAFDYLAKPVALEQLRSLIKSALSLPRQSGVTDDGQAAATAGQLIGESAAIEQVRQLIGKLARSQAPVYISGESGTGKELAARLIHDQSSRRAAPFVPVNCGAIPENLMESEFFGYRKGAFTGADSDREGFFQAAKGGTLFLDEVADLPLAMQVKLLRAIQEKKVRKVGSTAEEVVDVRIISATHRILKDCVDGGLFRQDLYYRLNVIELRMPPLRERHEDVAPLVEALLRRICGAQAPRLAPPALQALAGYSFPGNVRELENILERATALCVDNAIAIADLQLAPVAAVSGSVGRDGETLDEYLNRVERQAILEALTKTAFNRTAAARLLGVTFRSLRYRIERLGIEE